MTRRCDCCGRIIPLGKPHVELLFIGIENMEKLFKTQELDFCSFECLVKFVEGRKYER
jgi:hypothetical protein